MLSTSANNAEVWSLVGMDLIVGPFKKFTTKGNQYILTMTCYFSKWVEALPLPDKTAQKSSYCRHECPNNEGREFVNEVS